MTLPLYELEAEVCSSRQNIDAHAFVIAFAIMVFLSTGCTIGLDQPELKKDFKGKNKVQNEVNIEMKENVPEGNNNYLPPVDESNQQLAMGAVLDSYITNSSVATHKGANEETKCEEDDKSIEDKNETKVHNFAVHKYFLTTMIKEILDERRLDH